MSGPTAQRRQTITVTSAAELPCGGQTTAQVKQWISRARPSVGDTAVVRVGYGGVYDYHLAILVAVDHTRQRRLVVESSGCFGRSFYRDGRNCLHPKGQTHLIEPTPTVVKAATEGISYLHPGGSFYI